MVLETKEEVTLLEEGLVHLNRAYYRKGSSLVSDADYDRIVMHLKEVAKREEGLVLPSSPLYRVGAPIDENETVPHPVPMMSLDNSEGLSGFDEFLDRLKKGLGKEPSLIAELKLDGVGFSILYIDRSFSLGLSRGDGARGEDISHTLKTIQNLPLRLAEGAPRYLLVRGEVIILDEDFEEMNRARESQGMVLRANPRNTVAGALRSKDPKDAARVPMTALGYEVAMVKGETISTHTQSIALLNRVGFPLDPRRVVGTGEEVKTFFREIQSRRVELGVDCDGIVAKVDEHQLRKKLGKTAKHPRWALALKFPARRAVTTLLGVDWQVGRTGALTPVARLKPVEVAGVVVRNATLHNRARFLALALSPGDRVEVLRAGDVIPQVVGVVPGFQGEEKRLTPPTQCPLCQEELKSEGEGTHLICPNTECSGRILQGLRHFVGSSGMDMEGMAGKSLLFLVKKGWVKNIVDLFLLESVKEDWVGLPGWGSKRVENILQGVEKAKEQPSWVLLTALGIPLVGPEVAKILLGAFGPDVRGLVGIAEEELAEVKGVGPQIATAVATSFKREEFGESLAGLERAGVRMDRRESRYQGGGRLTGKRVVFTGKLGIGRKEAKSRAESQGATVMGAVSSKTDFLIKGEGGGSKVKKAEALGIAVINEDTFLSYLE